MYVRALGFDKPKVKFSGYHFKVIMPIIPQLGETQDRDIQSVH